MIEFLSMNLKELTDILIEAKTNGATRVSMDISETALLADEATVAPTKFSSYRGDYRDLSINFDDKKKSSDLIEFIRECRNADGATFTGWKGGEYHVFDYTPVWVDNPGDCNEASIYNEEIVENADGIKTLVLGVFSH